VNSHHLWHGLRLSLAASLTCFATLMSWRGFSNASSEYLVPLLGFAILVAVVGALLRWLRVPVLLVLGAQLVLGALAVPTFLVGTPIPVGADRESLDAMFAAAMESAQIYAPPLSALVPGIHPIMIPLGIGCLILVDLIALGLRRVPLSGIVLLAIYSAPVSLMGGGVSWWIFVASAAGFLTMLHLHEEDHLVRWGRSLGHPIEDQGLGIRTGEMRGRALATGTIATAAALMLPLLIPTLSLSLFDGGFGPGDGDVEIDNPVTDLRRDLNRPTDVALVQVTTDDPEPTYLRVSSLNWFTGTEWRAGDRDIPSTQIASGPMPPSTGLDGTEAGPVYSYQLRLTDELDTNWLPAYRELTEIDATGDWRYDVKTMDFFAASEDTSSEGLSYTERSKDIDYNALALTRAPASLGAVDPIFTDLPPDLPPIVRQLTGQVTTGLPSKFEQAVALQRWFRDGGGFTYDLQRAPSGNGTDALVEFLTEGNGGRVGYCEQFASAFAIMARTLNIPSRVSIGFLNPEPLGGNTYEFSAWDMHAWPELYFPGAGWVPFEPTPGARDTVAPDYTRIDLPDPAQETTDPQTAQPSDDEPSRGASDTARPQESQGPDEAAGDGGGLDVPWRLVLLSAGVVVLLAGGLLTPLLLRRSRREHRWRAPGGPEAAFAELRDTVVDLGETWPDGLSPRAIGQWLGSRLGDPAAERVERPLRGRNQSPEASAALDRIVSSVEVLRYARPTQRDWSGLRPDVETVVASLRAGATRAAVLRSSWWPRSAFRRATQVAVTPESVEVVTQGSLVDHVR